MYTAGGGPAESNLKFDNALLRAAVHSPGSRELCREGSDARVTPRVSRAKAVPQVVYSVWSIVCVYISRPYRQFSWHENGFPRV